MMLEIYIIVLIYTIVIVHIKQQYYGAKINE